MQCTQFLAIWWPNTKCGTYSMNVLHAFDYHSLWCNFTWKFPCFTITFVKHYGDCSYRSVTQQSNAWLFKMCGIIAAVSHCWSAFDGNKIYVRTFFLWLRLRLVIILTWFIALDEVAALFFSCNSTVNSISAWLNFLDDKKSRETWIKFAKTNIFTKMLVKKNRNKQYVTWDTRDMMNTKEISRDFLNC